MRRKTKVKKLLALCLVLAMVLSMNVTVFAEESAGAGDPSQSPTQASQGDGNTDAGENDEQSNSNSVKSDLNEANDETTPAAQTTGDEDTSADSGNGDQSEAANVAEINETGYGSLQSAIDAVTDGTKTTIKLLKDTAESITVSDGKNIVLDLNGKTLTNEANEDTITVDLGATLEVQGTGTVDNVSHQRAAVVNNGTAILSGGSYTRSAEASTSMDDANNNSYYNILNHGDMTINDGVSVTSTGAFSSLIDNGYYSYTDNNPRLGYVEGTNQAKPELVINGGTFSGGINTIKNDDAATVTINGGTFSNVTQAVLFNANKAIINNGNFNVDSEADNLYAVFNCNYNAGTNVVNTEIKDGTFKGSIYNSKVAKLSISGGTFNNKVESVSTENISISGGTFAKEDGTPLDVTAYLAEGCKMDGTTGVVTKYVAQIGEKDYETFAEAYSEAQENDTIKVLADADWVNTAAKGDLNVAKNITIDLNGHTLTPVYTKANGTSAGAYLYLNTADKTLTIEDNSEAQNGVLTTTYSSYVVRASKGNFVLNSGTLETKASRTVYVPGGTFNMTGGTLINSMALADVANKTNGNVIEVDSSGKATISGGTIKATNATDPIPGARLKSDKGQLIVTGGTFETGTAEAIVKSGKGALTVTGGTFENCNGPSVSITAGGVATIGSDGENAEKFTLPELAIGQNGVVAVKDNVTVEKVTAIPASDSTDYTFKVDNEFGGQYGNDFTSNIKGNGLYCEEPEGSSYYKVTKITDEDNSLIVAKITHSDNTTALFGDLGAAMTALQNGDTLTLKQDVENTTKDSWKSTASNVTINLAGHNIKITSANYGLWFWPTSSNVTENDVVRIEGQGSIQEGKQYAVYCSTNGNNSAKPLYTLSIGDEVNLGQADNGESSYPVGLYGQQTRLYLEAAQKDESYDYATVTDAAAKTTIGGKTYVYSQPDRALNDQSDDGGVVTLVNDCTPGAMTVSSPYTLTLNMNNKNLTSSYTTQYALIANGAGLTIKNGTIDHVYSYAADSVAVGMDKLGTDNSKLVLENVTIKSSAKKVTAVNINGNLTGVQVTLKGCTINCAGATSTVGVYFPIKGGTLNIINTSITAHNALQVKGGTVTVKEEEGETALTSTGAKATPGATSSGCTNTGDGIYVEDTYGFNPIVNVLSGTIKSTGEGTSALQYFDNEQENATGRIEVSDGTFSNDVTEYCVDGKKAIANDDGTTYTIGDVEQANVVTYTCMTDGNITSVANVTGGGVHNERSEVTLNATAMTGLTFKGWYEVSSVKTNSAGEVTSVNYGQLESEESSYTFTMPIGAEGVKLVAVYESNGEKVRLRIGGADFKVNGKVQHSGYDKTFAVGTQISVEYTGSSSFYHWKNGSDKIVTTGKEYTFTIVSNTELTPVFTNEESMSGSAFVEFISAYDQVLQADMWSSEDMEGEHSLPAGPSKIGGTFLHWSMDADAQNPEEATVASILDAVKTGNSKHITVKPVYEDSEDKYTITIHYSDADIDSTTYADQAYGTAIYVTAKAIDGKQFSHWASDSAGENVLSYSQKYGVQVSKDITLYPIYVDSSAEVTAKPTINITNIFASVVDDKNKVSFEATRDVPEGYELLEHGMLRTTDPLLATTDYMTEDNEGITKKKSSDTAQKGIYTLNIAVGNSTSTMIYARGYMITKNTATGEIETVYSEIKNGSFKELN